MTRHKCCMCARKVGFFGIKCRCIDEFGNNNIFCVICIQAKIINTDPGHLCSFNYKEHGQYNLSKNNQTVKCVKIDEI